MAITFPRGMPDELHVAGLSFILKPMIEVSPLRSGRLIAADLGPAIWIGEWSTSILVPAQVGIVRAWFDTLSSLREFYGYDKLRERPVAGFPVGFTGACTLTSVSAPYGVTLGSLPAGVVLSPGDYLSFDYNSGTNRALHRIAAGGTSAAGSVTLEVRPEVRSGYAGGAAVSLYRASARMLVIPDSYSESLSLPDLSTISFKAVQSL